MEKIDNLFKEETFPNEVSVLVIIKIKNEIEKSYTFFDTDNISPTLFADLIGRTFLQDFKVSRFCPLQNIKLTFEKPSLKEAQWKKLVEMVAPEVYKLKVNGKDFTVKIEPFMQALQEHKEKITIESKSYLRIKVAVFLRDFEKHREIYRDALVEIFGKKKLNQ